MIWRFLQGPFLYDSGLLFNSEGTYRKKKLKRFLKRSSSHSLVAEVHTQTSWVVPLEISPEVRNVQLLMPALSFP